MSSWDPTVTSTSTLPNLNPPFPQQALSPGYQGQKLGCHSDLSFLLMINPQTYQEVRILLISRSLNLPPSTLFPWYHLNVDPVALHLHLCFLSLRSCCCCDSFPALQPSQSSRSGKSLLLSCWKHVRGFRSPFGKASELISQYLLVS